MVFRPGGCCSWEMAGVFCLEVRYWDDVLYIFWLLSPLTQSLLPEFHLHIRGIGISLVHGIFSTYVIASIRVNRSLCLSSFRASAWGSRGAVHSLERGISAWNISRDVASLDFKCRLAREIEFHAVYIFSRKFHSVYDLGFEVGFRAQGRPCPGLGLATPWTYHMLFVKTFYLLIEHGRVATCSSALFNFCGSFANLLNLFLFERRVIWFVVPFASFSLLT